MTADVLIQNPSYNCGLNDFCDPRIHACTYIRRVAALLHVDKASARRTQGTNLLSTAWVCRVCTVCTNGFCFECLTSEAQHKRRLVLAGIKQASWPVVSKHLSWNRTLVGHSTIMSVLYGFMLGFSFQHITIIFRHKSTHIQHQTTLRWFQICSKCVNQ